MLLNCKFLCKKSVYFPNNYNYLSVKYDLCKRDWHCDVANLLERVTFCIHVCMWAFTYYWYFA